MIKVTVNPMNHQAVQSVRESHPYMSRVCNAHHFTPGLLFASCQLSVATCHLLVVLLSVLSHGDTMCFRLHVQYPLRRAAGHPTISSISIPVALSQLFRNGCQMSRVLRVVVRNNTVGGALPDIGNHDSGSGIPFHHGSGHGSVVVAGTHGHNVTHLVGVVLESSVQSASYCSFMACSIHSSPQLDRSKTCLVLLYPATASTASQQQQQQ